MLIFFLKMRFSFRINQRTFAFDSLSFFLRKDQNGVGNHVFTCLKEIKTSSIIFQTRFRRSRTQHPRPSLTESPG